MSSQAFEKFATVVLDVSINKMLDYGISAQLIDQVKRGVRVEVPVRGHMRGGYVYTIKNSCDFPKVQPISKVIEEHGVVTDDLFELALWISKYYCSPLRNVFKMMLPSSVRREMQAKQQLFVMRGKTKEELRLICEEIRNKHPAQAAVLDVMLQVTKGILLTELLEETQGTRSPVDTLAKKGLLVVDIVRIDRSPLINEEYFQTRAKKLNEEQNNALIAISESLDSENFATHLLHGVTGSGKTEVYLQAIDKALKMQKGTIMLVPEISLTTQTIERFRSRFEGNIAILHHRLSHGERSDEWHRIRRGDAKIVIGARSAIFSPVPNLGLIIVDEEHEQSYKQTDEAPCYHARDVAVMRGKFANGVVILGSATPSLESYYNAQNGKYKLSQLNIRADSASIPLVRIVDMKKEFEKAKGYTNFSDELLTGIKKRQEYGEQTILFLNRRGYHTSLICPACSNPVKCNHCDVALTFHLGNNTLACRLCAFEISPPPNQCPSCKSGHPLKFKGVGTEQVEKSLHAVLKDIKTLRMDADTTRHKGSHQKILREFCTGKADVLIGTQMIAKGLHFPNVTLVGVLNSDASLNIPDFRASETTFQLITQVSGRSGRGVIPGEVIIQTMMPENTTILLAAQQDYAKFYQEEISVREAFGYPPFNQLAKISFSGTNAQETCRTANEIRLSLSKHVPSSFELNPVIAAGHAKVKDKYRYQFLIRGASMASLYNAIQGIQAEILNIPRSVKMSIDVNPTSTFF